MGTKYFTTLLTVSEIWDGNAERFKDAQTKSKHIKNLVNYAYERFTDNKKHLDRIRDECSFEFLQDVILATRKDLTSDYKKPGYDIWFYEEAHTARDFDLCRKLTFVINTCEYFLQRKIEIMQGFAFEHIFHCGKGNPTLKPNKEIEKLWLEVRPVVQKMTEKRISYPGLHLNSF